MARLVWLETTTLFRRPLWILLVAFTGWIFYSGEISGLAQGIYIGLELPLLGNLRALFSAGEWGRAILLMLETFGGLFVSLLTALIAMGSLAPELVHREVLWTSHNGTRLRFALAKLIAVTSFTAFCLVLSASTTFLNSSMREPMSLAGWQYVLLYLASVWIRVSLWVALAMLLFSLTRSRWATVFIVFALHMVWFGTAGIWWEPSLFRLLHRNYIAWNFISAFAPFGIIPLAFSLQSILGAALSIALIGAAIWTRKRFPEWAGLKLLTVKAAVGGGIILAIGAGWGIMQAIQAQTAPFTAAELWEGRATFDRFYIWSHDYRFLGHPGEYTAVLLPPDGPIPGWVEHLAMGRELRRHDNVKEIILDGHLGEGERVAPASLVLLNPPGVRYPLELEKAISRYWQAVSPLVTRARPWLKTAPEVALIWPEDAFPYWSPVIHGAEFRISSVSLDGSTEAYQRTVAFTLAHTLSGALARDKSIHTYLTMYFMTDVDMREVEMALEWFRDRAEGKTPEFKIFAVMGLRSPAWKPEEAARVLQHWQRGEELGHENYIRTLLEGGN